MDKKKIIIIAAIAAAVVAAAGATVFFILNHKTEAYRNIKVYEMDGDATITREDIGEISAYDNMVLQSGDSIVMTKGRMTLQLDEDKYVYVEEAAELWLEATGTSSKSKTVIHLTKGEIVNEIQNKLNADSTYEVNTPNATMSVRGTTFYVNVFEEDGVIYSKCCVFEGLVETNLVYADGTIAPESKLVGVDRGKQVIIYEDDTTTDYLTAVEDIDYGALSGGIMEYVDLGPFQVTFTYNGSVFGSQSVEKGEVAEEPKLMPEPAGHWDFDFTTPIDKNTEIPWVSE